MIDVALITLLMFAAPIQVEAQVDTTHSRQNAAPLFYYYGSGDSPTLPPGMVRVRQRINQIRGRGAARSVIPYPVYVVLPQASSVDGDVAGAQRAPFERLSALQQDMLTRQVLDQLTRQLNRRFDGLENRLDRVEDLYYELVWRTREVLWRDEEQATVPTRDPDAEDPPEERADLQRPDLRRPPAPLPRTQLDLAYEVERALLETGLFRTADVVFEFDRSTLLPGSERILDAVGDVLERYDGIRLEVEGHTCNIGTSVYNQQLSEARAEMVRNYLVANFDIDSERISSRGFGLSRPLFSNDTSTGRTLNRRVEFIVQDE